MRTKLLGAVAALTFVAAGLAAQAQTWRGEDAYGAERSAPGDAAPRQPDGSPNQPMAQSAPRTQSTREAAPGERAPPKEEGVQMSSDNEARSGEGSRRDGGAQAHALDIRVGTRIPEAFALRLLPRSIAEAEPDHRDYEYFLVGDNQIVIVAPRTRAIVRTLDAQSRASRAAVETAPPED